MPAWWATGSSTSATCTASSRVGTSTSPSGCDGSATSVMRASIGTPNASVLPEPVLARPHTSRPVIATGIASVWMLNGWAKPQAARPSSMRAGTPSSAKPVGASTGGSTLKRVRFDVLTWPASDGLAGGRGRSAAFDEALLVELLDSDMVAPQRIGRLGSVTERVEPCGARVVTVVGDARVHGLLLLT